MEHELHEDEFRFWSNTFPAITYFFIQSIIRFSKGEAFGMHQIDLTMCNGSICFDYLIWMKKWTCLHVLCPKNPLIKFCIGIRDFWDTQDHAQDCWAVPNGESWPFMAAPFEEKLNSRLKKGESMGLGEFAYGHPWTLFSPFGLKKDRVLVEIYVGIRLLAALANNQMHLL